VAQCSFSSATISCEAHLWCCAVLPATDDLCFVAALGCSLSTYPLWPFHHTTLFRNDHESCESRSIFRDLLQGCDKAPPLCGMPQTSETSCNADSAMASQRQSLSRLDFNKHFMQAQHSFAVHLCRLDYLLWKVTRLVVSILVLHSAAQVLTSTYRDGGGRKQFSMCVHGNPLSTSSTICKYRYQESPYMLEAAIHSTIPQHLSLSKPTPCPTPKHHRSRPAPLLGTQYKTLSRYKGRCVQQFKSIPRASSKPANAKLFRRACFPRQVSHECVLNLTTAAR
jgi:hypothetical protein